MKRKRRGGAPSGAVRRREYPRRTYVRPGGGQPPPPAPTPATGPDEPREAPAPPAPAPALPPPVPAGPWLSWRAVRTLLRPPPADPVEAPWARNISAALLLALMLAAAALAR